MNRMGSGNLYSEGGFPDLDADVRSNYIMNTTLLGVEKADAILLIGSNPRIEAPVFNARYIDLQRALVSRCAMPSSTYDLIQDASCVYRFALFLLLLHAICVWGWFRVLRRAVISIPSLYHLLGCQGGFLPGVPSQHRCSSILTYVNT